MWKSPSDYVLIKAIMHSVEEAGHRHVDCAWIYENEPTVGRALSGVIATGAVHGEQLWVTYKLCNTVHHPDRVEGRGRHAGRSPSRVLRSPRDALVGLVRV